MEVTEDLPGPHVAPGLPMPRHAVAWLICSLILSPGWLLWKLSTSSQQNDKTVAS